MRGISLTVLTVTCVTALEQYKYRIITPPASPTAAAPAPRQFQPRISRQIDTRADPATGPYLNKEGFFSSGFLEDLFGLGRPAEPAVTFQGKTSVRPSLSSFGMFR